MAENWIPFISVDPPVNVYPLLFTNGVPVKMTTIDQIVPPIHYIPLYPN